jgi:para-nitrobenzyl esterase
MRLDAPRGARATAAFYITERFSICYSLALIRFGAKDMTTTASTTSGKLRGLHRSGHLAFLGVPYAQPPVGERRFLAAGPAPLWQDERGALEAGCVAPQDPLVPPPFRAEGPESEDCLFLNVYTRAADTARRPVLFWIHGGGFSHGAGSQPAYDGGPLVERGDVVVVTINYRVGALGYLYLGAHGGTDWGAANNAGQLDQIAALRWVRDNIAAFGGDPDNVTIFGQSAGSVAVGTLLAMPAADGLYAKAILQSGTPSRLGGIEQAAAVTRAYLERLGIPEGKRAALQNVAVADMLRVQGARGAMSPVVDGRSLPEHPVTAIRAGVARRIPMMIGTTRDEQKLYVARDRAELTEEELVAQVRATLPPRGAARATDVVDVYRRSREARGLPVSRHDIIDAVATASRFRIPAIRLAESQRAHQPRTFLYQFDWTSPARGGAMGARHGLEIPFVFGTIDAPGNDRTIGTGPAVERLSQQMMDAWIAFARSGDPSHAHIGDWPAYDSDRRPTMIFGPETGLVAAPFEEERAIWGEVLGTHSRAVEAPSQRSAPAG